MKTAIIHRMHICQATIFLGLCAALLAALPDRAAAQVRIINGRLVGMPDMPGGMPPGMDSPPPSASKPDSSGKDAGGPWLPSEVVTTSLTSTNLEPRWARDGCCPHRG